MRRGILKNETNYRENHEHFSSNSQEKFRRHFQVWAKILNPSNRQNKLIKFNRECIAILVTMKNEFEYDERLKIRTTREID